MNGREKEMLEIVVFNGAPSVECGRALPIVRRASDGRYCVLETEIQAVATWLSEEEAIAFAKAGRWTRFDCPIPLASSWGSGSDGRPAQPLMVIFAAQSLLDYAGRATWPVQVHGESLRWCRLLGRTGSIRAACAPAKIVEALLTEWANCLHGRYDAMYGAGGEHDVLKRTADYMLCAAKTRASRWQAYIRYALAQSPERVRQIFDTFTNSEFPDVPWQSYVDQMEDLRRLLKSVPAGKSQSGAPAPSAAVRGKLQGIAGRRPIRLAA
jgi:hypothetical protein